MSEENLIYGIDVHSRSLTSFPTEENRTIFCIASYTVKNDSKIYVLEADDRWSRLNGKEYNFDRSIGEVLYLNAHPKEKNLIFAECSMKVISKKTCSAASICHLDENKKIAKTLSLFSPENSNFLLLKTIFDPTGNQLGIISENCLTICDVEDSGKELKQSWQKELPTKSKMNTFVWDKHSPNGIYLGCCSELLLFDTRTNKDTLIFDNGFQRITAVDCNPISPNRIVVGTEEGRLALWDTRKTDQPIIFKFDHQYPIWDLKYNNTYDQLVISCGSDGKIFLHNFESAEKIDGKIESELIMESEDSIYCCAWAGSDPFIFAGIGHDGRLIASKVRKTLKYKLLSGN
uniref:Uncharacterized protein n=1 Tax=Panagrolaimus sp. JU765 TaxID=591449 RepID=A0AC34R276_9BILA